MIVIPKKNQIKENYSIKYKNDVFNLLSKIIPNDKLKVINSQRDEEIKHCFENYDDT